MPEKKLIYIADDEVNICNIIQSFLVKAGFDAVTFHDGKSILEAFDSKPADMLIVDIMMPEMDGFALCSFIRQKCNVPIIIVSAKDTEADKITGLSLGGDDYLAKPFSPMELVVRIKGIFRRMELGSMKQEKVKKIRIANFLMDPETKQAEVNGKNVGLTGMEFHLLYYLMENKGKAVSRTELLGKIWGFENKVETRATDDMMKRIRKKLSGYGSDLKINTIRGFGFKIEDGE